MIGPDGWPISKPAKCDSFSPYTSNPQMCKACNEPVTEHVSYMKRHEEKQARIQKAKMLDVDADYDKKRERVLEFARTLIDSPIEKEEEVDLGGGVKMPMSYLEKLKNVFLPKIEEQVAALAKPETPVKIKKPPEVVRYVTDEMFKEKWRTMSDSGDGEG